jgi:hypothetical protein
MFSPKTALFFLFFLLFQIRQIFQRTTATTTANSSMAKTLPFSDETTATLPQYKQKLQ